MIGPCVCTTIYFCVSCRVKRGDYSEWMRTPRKPGVPCNVDGCERMAETKGQCWKHYNNTRYRLKHGHPRPAIPRAPYIPVEVRMARQRLRELGKLADR